MIGARHVLTAAHCTDGVAAESINVIVGDTNLGSMNDALAFTIAVAKIIEHEDYNSDNMQNDIAILELDEDIDLYSYPHIKPICLPQQGSTYDGQDAVVSGWGAVVSGGPATSALNEVKVTLFANEDCGEMTDLMTEDMICAGVPEGGKDSCQGDSGGGLITTDSDNNGAATLVGVVSWGFGCGVQNQPGIYAEVSHFLAWINGKITSLSTCPPPDESSWIPGVPCCTKNNSFTLPPNTSPMFSTPTWPYTATGMSTRSGQSFLPIVCFQVPQHSL